MDGGTLSLLAGDKTRAEIKTYVGKACLLSAMISFIEIMNTEYQPCGFVMTTDGKV